MSGLIPRVDQREAGIRSVRLAKNGLESMGNKKEGVGDTFSLEEFHRGEYD